MKNWTKFEGKIFPSHICPKWGSYLQKTCSWCLTNFKFGTQANYLMPRKNLKITFLSGARNIVKMGSEIYKYFLLFFIISKYLMFVLRPVFNSSPQFYSHLSCSLLRLKLILLQILHLQLTVFNSYPNIYQKWNWAAGNLQIFLSEIIIQQENGCCGGNLAWISNSIFTKG